MSFWLFTKKNYTNLNKYSNENVIKAHKMPESHKSTAALNAAFDKFQNGQKILRIRATKRQERNLLKQRVPASEHSHVRNWMPTPTMRNPRPAQSHVRNWMPPSAIRNTRAAQSHVRNWMPTPAMKGARRTRKYINKGA